MGVTQSPCRDEGTGYEIRPPTFKSELVEVGRGKPMGELLRRYWHPIGLVSDANRTPRKVRALGEDLILFRDGAGRAGLVHARCCHRGTTLYYGKVEARGSRGIRSKSVTVSSSPLWAHRSASLSCRATNVSKSWTMASS